MIVWGLILVLNLPVSSTALAEDDSEYSDDEESDVAREPAAAGKDAAPSSKARYRLYPGGQDEEDIKVQAVLPSPVRSFDQPAAAGAIAPTTNSSESGSED